MLKVAFIENYDSFSYNIVSLLKQNDNVKHLEIIDNKTLNDKKIQYVVDNFTHLLIGPGPGDPRENCNSACVPNMLILKQLIMSFRGYILGVCLGHQLIGLCFGAKVRRGKSPMHGKILTIKLIKENLESTYHNGPLVQNEISSNNIDSKKYTTKGYVGEIFKGCKNEFKGVLYHSLKVYDIKPPLREVAFSNKNEVNMALMHENRKIYGIQFHFESILSEHGQKIIDNFLSLTT